MALEMRERCEKCGGSIAFDDAAVICSYECTFCPSCAAAMAHLCPKPRCEKILVGRIPGRPMAALDQRLISCATRSRWYVASPNVNSDDLARLK
jgi:hypothetical protein